MDYQNWSVTPTRNGPDRKYTGFSIPHGEASTISYALTTKDGKYRPTTFFVYKPCKNGIASLDEIRNNNYKKQKEFRVLTLPEIKSGYDAIGALLITPNKCWWSGSILSVEDTKKLKLKNSGPTTIQVAIALISSIKWMLDHPTEGLLSPEDLPYKKVLPVCYPYLGRIHSDYINLGKKIKNPIFDSFKV